MIKADIVDRVVDLAQIPRAKAATAVETVIEAMRSALGAGDRIELRGFGVFQVKRRKRGIGRNPEDRSRGLDPAGQHDPIQAGQGFETCPSRLLKRTRVLRPIFARDASSADSTRCILSPGRGRQSDVHPTGYRRADAPGHIRFQQPASSRMRSWPGSASS